MHYSDNAFPSESNFDSTTIGYSVQDIVIAIHTLAPHAMQPYICQDRRIPNGGNSPSSRRGCCSRLSPVPWICLVHKRTWVAKTFQTGFGPLQLVRYQYCQVATKFLLRFSITAILKKIFPVSFLIPLRQAIRFLLQLDAATRYFISRGDCHSLIVLCHLSRAG